MAFWTILLIIHGLLAVALLGAITHQAVSVWMPVRSKAGNFVTRFRAVPSTSYVMAIIVLYVVTLLPAYWAFWRQPLSEDYAAARKNVTLLLAIIVWANFLVGHIANNARGFGS
jgi:hypothetical protein